MNSNQIKDITQTSFNEKQQNALIQLFQHITTKQKPNLWLWLVLGINGLLILFLLFFILQPSLPANYIQIGRQSVLSVSQVLPDHQRLIPKGNTLDEGEVDEIIIELIPIYDQSVQFEVMVDESTKAIGELTNPFNYLLITQLYEETPPNHLNNHHALQSRLNFDTETKQYVNSIYLKIFLTSPSEEDYQSAYDAIAGKRIAFSILFTVIPNA